MAGAIFRHNNVLAIGSETVTGSKTGITIPGVSRIYSVTPGLTVTTAGQVANNADVTAVIAADGKSFSLYTFTQAGAASTTATTVNWTAVVE